MNARTDTQCAYCTHHKVCGKLNIPISVVEAITEFNVVDDNGIDIIVRCMDFESIKPTLNGENLDIAGSAYYMCKRNSDDNQIDWFEKKEEN